MDRSRSSGTGCAASRPRSTACGRPPRAAGDGSRGSRGARRRCRAAPAVSSASSAQRRARQHWDGCRRPPSQAAPALHVTPRDVHGRHVSGFDVGVLADDSVVSEEMSAHEYHEALWEGVPEGQEPPHMAARLAFLLEHAPVGARVLDVGCGEGRFTSELVLRWARGGRDRRRRRAAAPRARARPGDRRAPRRRPGIVAACGRELRRRLGRGGDRARRRHRRLALGGAPRAALGRCARAQHPRPRAPHATRARPPRARVRDALRPALRSPALLHPPHAGRAAGGLRLRGDQRRARSAGRPAPGACCSRRRDALRYRAAPAGSRSGG